MTPRIFEACPSVFMDVLTGLVLFSILFSEWKCWSTWFGIFLKKIKFSGLCGGREGCVCVGGVGGGHMCVPAGCVCVCRRTYLKHICVDVMCVLHNDRVAPWQCVGDAVLAFVAESLPTGRSKVTAWYYDVSHWYFLVEKEHFRVTTFDTSGVETLWITSGLTPLALGLL